MLGVTTRVFEAMQQLDITALATIPLQEIRPVLACLVRICMASPVDDTAALESSRQQIMALLLGNEVADTITPYLQVNYEKLEQDLKMELQACRKATFYEGKRLEFGLHNNLVLEIESVDAARRVRVVLLEIFYIQWQLVHKEKIVVPPEVIDEDIYQDVVVDVLCFALAELPSLLNMLDLTDVLIHVHNGQNIVCALLASFPDYYHDVMTHVISTCKDRQPKHALLMALSNLNPCHALASRAMCVEQLKAPSFMLCLCLNHPKDLVAFLSGLLLGNDRKLRGWFAVYMRSDNKQKQDTVSMIRTALLEQLTGTTELSVREPQKEVYTMKGSALLRLYCALRHMAGIKFNDSEINALSLLVTSRPQPTQSGLKFLAVGLCVIIACPSLISTEDLENKSVDWLQWLIKQEAFFRQDLGEMLLLLAIHFHNNLIGAIDELVCSTLAMKIPITSNSTKRMKRIFTQEIFTEQIIASHAVRVPVTRKLNANMPGYLPIHCIYQLLKSGTFLKHNVPIKQWIYRQICNSVRPLHAVMPALIEVYVHTLILPRNSEEWSGYHIHQPFLESEILQIFKGPQTQNNSQTANIEIQCAMTAQLLMLYYLVLCEETWLANFTSNSMQGSNNLADYSQNFLSELPMKHLLQKAQEHHGDYTVLFHSLLRIIASNYPHLVMVDDWIEDHWKAQTVSAKRLAADIRHKLQYSFDHLVTEPEKAISLFQFLLRLAPEDLTGHSDLIVKNMPTVFAKHVPRVTQEFYKKIWMRINSILPVNFWNASLNAIKSANGGGGKMDWSEIVLDPLRVLRLSNSAFYSPHTLMILLRILQGSLAASRAFFSKQTRLNGRKELETSLIATQESAALHFLIDVLSDMQKNLSDRVSILKLSEAEGIICSFLHREFIREPSLVKLVHFQTYSRDVIPVLISGVPSMHICLDFLHELLNVPEIGRQIFIIDLTSHYVSKYHLPLSLRIAKLCVNTIESTLSELPLSSNAFWPYLRNVVPALVRLTAALPILTDDSINILISTGKRLHAQGALGCYSTPMGMTSTRRPNHYLRSILLIEEGFESLVSKLIQRVGLY